MSNVACHDDQSPATSGVASLYELPLSWTSTACMPLPVSWAVPFTVNVGVFTVAAAAGVVIDTSGAVVSLLAGCTGGIAKAFTYIVAVEDVPRRSMALATILC